MYDEVLVTVRGGTATPVGRVSLLELDLQERAHPQEWLVSNPAILGPGVEIVTSEYDRWRTAAGDPVLDRLGLLGIAPDGHLIVAELKRGMAPHTIHMQAVDSAAMAGRLTPQEVAELYSAEQRERGREIEAESALTLLTTEFLLTSETVRRPRIVLVASDFPPSVTTSVAWLNEQNIDISLIRFRPYQLADGELVVSFNRLFPVPDVGGAAVTRRTDSSAGASDAVGAPWDEPSMRRLAEQGNPATLVLLDLCSADDLGTVGVKEIAAHAGLTWAAVRAQLAGLTMRLSNPDNGFAQNRWPVGVEWLPGGVACYRMDPKLAAVWRGIRQQGATVDDVSA